MIKERAPSNNYLAIRNASGHYYLNGNWRIDFPRPLTFAGSIWHYDRRPQGFAAPDHITSLGPTTELVYLVLLYQDTNVGVNYEYSVPESSAYLNEPDTYAWTFTPFGPCSASCGSGTHSRVVTCNSRSTLEKVDDELCDSSNRPSELEQCGVASCPPQWSESEWSKCSAPCGKNGTQARTIQCEEISSNGCVQSQMANLGPHGRSINFLFFFGFIFPIAAHRNYWTMLSVCKRSAINRPQKCHAMLARNVLSGMLDHGKR